jgi:protein gp37
MPRKTSIEWTDFSWNPIRAKNRETGKVGWYCEHLSDGCRRCYAEVINRVFGTQIDFARQNRDRVEIFFDEKVLHAKMPQVGSKIFVCDMADLFGEFVRDEWIADILAVVEAHRGITFQVLTKRAERLRSYFTARPMLANLWLGTSVESRRHLDRLDQLRATPAALRFVSFEPLLEGLDDIDLHGIGWVITGAESGAGARSMQMDWVRGIRDQCIAADVPFFLKQAAVRGRKIPLPELDGRQWREFPGSTQTGGMQLNLL